MNRDEPGVNDVRERLLPYTLEHKSLESFPVFASIEKQSYQGGESKAPMGTPSSVRDGDKQRGE